MSKWAIMLQDKVIREFEINEGDRLIIGRGDDADVKIDNTAISRHHAALEIQNGKPFLQDLCSLNGSLVNGNKIDFIQLTPGDEVILGKFYLVHGTDFADKHRLSTSAMPMDLDDATIFAPGKPKVKTETRTDEPSTYQLHILNGSAHPATLSLAGRNSVKIGKADNSDICTPGFFIAANQCFINKREDGYYILPQKSMIKTKINGHPLTSDKKLHPGDIISIRGHRIRFEKLS